MKTLLLFLGCFWAFGLFAQTLPTFETFRHRAPGFDQNKLSYHAYEPSSERIFVASPGDNRLYTFDISNSNKVFQDSTINLNIYQTEVSGIAAHQGIVALTFINNLPQARGKLVLLDTAGQLIKQFTVGAYPSFVRFSDDGRYLIVGNEGIPADDYSVDPPGSVSVLQILSANPSSLSQSDIFTIRFDRLDSTAYHPLLRVYGNQGQQLPSEDLEPEGIALLPGGNKAVISLQENNGLALINFSNFSLDTVLGLGWQSHQDSSHGLDGSAQNPRINIRSYKNLFGLYQPKGLSAFQQQGKNYILSANQGAYRAYSAYNETQLVKNTALNPSTIPNRNQYMEDSLIGSLRLTKTMGNARNTFIYDSMFTFGTRSWSIWNDSLNLVWDSGDDLAQWIAQAFPNQFNSLANSNQSYKQASVRFGPEAHLICYGEVDGLPYAFVGLKQMGAVAIYDLSNIQAPRQVSLLLDRDFSLPASDPQSGDQGISDLSFIPPSESPNGLAMLVATHGVSGSLSVYELGQGIGYQEWFQAEQDWQVFPNPSRGYYQSNHQKPLRIYNAQGSFIKEVRVGETIDLSKQVPGYYLLRNAAGRTLKVLKR